MKAVATIAGLVTIVTTLAPVAHGDTTFYGSQGDGSGPNYEADLLDMGIPGDIRSALILGGTICVQRQDGITESTLINAGEATGVTLYQAGMSVRRGEYHFCPTEMVPCMQTGGCGVLTPVPAVLGPGQTREPLPPGEIPVYVS